MDFKLWEEILMKKGFFHFQRIIFNIQNLLSIIPDNFTLQDLAREHNASSSPIKNIFRFNSFSFYYFKYLHILFSKYLPVAL